MTATAEARKARAAALNDLDWHWGGAYDLAVTRAGWLNAWTITVPWSRAAPKNCAR